MYAISLEASLELAGLGISFFMFGFGFGALAGAYKRFLFSGGGVKCE